MCYIFLHAINLYTDLMFQEQKSVHFILKVKGHLTEYISQKIKSPFDNL